MLIKYLRQAEIDKKKWDECVAKSSNGLIYSTSIFLDNMAPNWDGLVMGDYAAIMPLPCRQKYGIYYVYPPAFSQQIGITGIEEVTQEIIHSFIKSIPAKFKYVEMNFNVTNIFEFANQKKRENYILSLVSTFEVLKKGFSRSALRNIKKAIDLNISVKENIDFKEIIKIHRRRFKDQIGASVLDYGRLENLFLELQKSNNLFTLGAYKSNKSLIGGSLYFVYKNRITFIMNGNSEESLLNGATHLLMFYTIEKFSSKDLILDFEGSDFVDFVKFYKQYGATPEIYKLIKINHLPWPISLLKK